MGAEVRHVSQSFSRQREIVEECVLAYELDFRDGRPRSLTEYLPAGSTALRKTVLMELIKVELGLRWKQGERPRLEEYLTRYPQVGPRDTLPPDLVYEGYLAARAQGADVELEQFCVAFPHQRQAVLSLAQRTINQSTAITRQKPGGPWYVGMRFGDFELQALLGEGAFGKVFLAHQMPLARQVALKITANRGTEGRTMASLEHDNIVQVYSELVLPQQDARLLCMQYVPGTTLAKVISYLAARPNETVTGENILAAVDCLASVPAALDTASLKQRQRLTEADMVGAITLLGSQLAEALAYAHQRGVLHRDIKPDNVLISQYGRPLLVDFNLSLDPHRIAGTSAGLFGGSLAYMSPEHLDAFNPAHPTPPEAVDERSDIYSLGVTLYELLHLRRPFPDPPPAGNPLECLETLAAQRREGGPPASAPATPATDAVEHVIARCLAPEPANRYPSAEKLCQAFEAARELHGIRRALPVPGGILSIAERRPLTVFVLAVLVPCLLGSLINIAYNWLRIGGELTAEQRIVFHNLLLGYNLVVYPVSVALLVYRVLPVFYHPVRPSLARVRRRIVGLPLWIVLLGALGWLPGALVFPLGLELAAGPLGAAMFGHFFLDFVLSGLIAVTYSYLGAETLLLRVLYPRYLVGQPQPQRTARRELRRVPIRITIAQVAAALIPLLGATLVVLIGPAEQEGYGVFRVLVILLIVLGMVGFCLSMTAVRILQQTIQALTAAVPPSSTARPARRRNSPSPTANSKS